MELLDSLLSRLDEPTLLATFAALSIVARLIGNLIPDDEVGWRGTVRKVAKVLGLYVSNRITAGVSTNDVAKVLVGSNPSPKAQELAPQIVEVAAEEVARVSPFKRFAERESNDAAG